MEEDSAVQQLTNLRITVPPPSSGGEGVNDSSTEGVVSEVPTAAPDEPQEEGKSVGVVCMTLLRCNGVHRMGGGQKRQETIKSSTHYMI